MQQIQKCDLDLNDKLYFQNDQKYGLKIPGKCWISKCTYKYKTRALQSKHLRKHIKQKEFTKERFKVLFPNSKI